jgi:uncharacterized phage protein (predicted DNA packaging)
MLTLEKVKEYLRIDHNIEDSFLSSLMVASEKYIINATHPNADKEDENFQLAQLLYIAHCYENKDLKAKMEINSFFQSLITQITYTSSDPL